MIEAINIIKSYEDERVLDEVTLKVKKGTSTSLIGPSGCGKSTLIRIILGLVKQDSGTVKLAGEEFRDDNKLELRRKTGYVIQKGGLFPHLTASKNCTLLAEHLNWNVERTERRLEELSDLTNISRAMLSRYPGELSGGQRQRISLMRALMLDPEIILLDEPLGSIDPLVRYELQNDLNEIFKTLNKTVLLVTHDLGEAAFLGDEIVLMKEGRFVQQGPVKEILNNPVNKFVEQFITAQRSPLEDMR